MGAETLGRTGRAGKGHCAGGTLTPSAEQCRVAHFPVLGGNQESLRTQPVPSLPGRAGRKMMAGLELAVSEAKSHVSSVGPVAQRVDGRKTGVAEGERGPRRRARSDIPELASPFQAS